MNAVEKHREQIANRLGEPDCLQFPSGWTMSSSWQRAQAAPSTVGPVNPVEFDVLLGYADKDGRSKHRVLFALYEGQLRAECECDGYRFRGWCAHVALLRIMRPGSQPQALGVVVNERRRSRDGFGSVTRNSWKR